MSMTTTYTATILDTIAEQRDLARFTGEPIYIRTGSNNELAGWLGCPLPSSERPSEHTESNDKAPHNQLSEPQAKNTSLTKLLLEALSMITERLCDKNDELRAELKGAQEENTKLREERDEFKALFELKDTQFSNVLSSFEMIKAENHKLRELVRDAWGNGHPSISCGDCKIRTECHANIEEALKDDNGQWNARCLFELRIEDRMRELGIDVK